MENEIDLYNSNKDWYDHLPERKYMILEYLPKCNGKVLSVGTHEFNKNDEICCKKCEYETIDIHEKCKDFGSSFKHTTIDFLDYEPGYKFNHILLFGVLGIPQELEGYNYTLYKNENKTIEKIDELLDINGTVLLGPDVNESSCASYDSTYEFWKKFVQDNDIIKSKYSLIKFMNKNEFRCNPIIILKKNF